MLTILNNFNDLNFRQLMDVYQESNTKHGRMRYSNLYENLQIIYAEQDFYAYLKIFFSVSGSRYAVWTVGGAYKAALRLEPYNDDGLLITALETAPESRNKGYGTMLVREVLLELRKVGIKKVYSHVAKSNIQSLSLHRSCGFYEASDSAVFLDGSYHYDYFTLCYQ